ncbi:MAG TPA: hypothetical protein VL485_32105 [Ktedonobacteraceae bacterium]|nr:hypothetical protein [Ktedonobacteraceae bacterium]
MSKHFGDNFHPVIPTQDGHKHTVAVPFCFGAPNCPCHEDTENVNQVDEHYNSGLMTANEATKFVKGDMSNAVL